MAALGMRYYENVLLVSCSTPIPGERRASFKLRISLSLLLLSCLPEAFEEEPVVHV